MNKNPRYVSILIVPDGGRKTIQLKVHSFTFKIALIFIVLSIIMAGFGVVVAGRVAAKLHLSNHLSHQNKILREKNRKINLLENEIRDIREQEEKIRVLVSSFLNKGRLYKSKENGIGDSGQKEIEAFVNNVKRKQKSMVISGDERVKLARKYIPNLRPVNGWITRGFSHALPGGQKFAAHKGVDIAAATGTPILAAAPGIVTFSGWDEYFGHVIEIDHGFGYTSKYGHCSYLAVKKGDIVKRGQTVALTGSTGHSTGPHLHYEIRKNGIHVDPLLYFVN